MREHPGIRYIFGMFSMQPFVGVIANPVFLGIVSGGALGGAMMILRKTPETLYSFFKRKLTISITVRGHQQAYEYINMWIAKRPFSKKAQRLQLAETYDEDGERQSFDFTLGIGQHFVRHNGRYLWIHRSRDEKKVSMGNASGDETIEIVTFGRSQETLRSIINEACAEFNDGDSVRVYTWNQGYFEIADIKTKRSLESIFLPDEQKQRLVADLEAFYAKRAIYARRGTPWRRGYLFRGQPGTGKTSLVLALASHFNRPIYIINLANVGGDHELQRAMNRAGSTGFVLMEDIDGVDVTHQRSEAGLNNKDDTTEKGNLTLPGILNAVDGIASREGRVLFVTSNHAEKLDAALIRPGRVDCDETIGPVEEDVAWRMARAFDPEIGEGAFQRLVKGRLPLPAATLQDMLVKRENGTGTLSVQRPDNDVGEQDVAA